MKGVSSTHRTVIAWSEIPTSQSRRLLERFSAAAGEERALRAGDDERDGINYEESSVIVRDVRAVPRCEVKATFS